MHNSKRPQSMRYMRLWSFLPISIFLFRFSRASQKSPDKHPVAPNFTTNHRFIAFHVSVQNDKCTPRIVCNRIGIPFHKISLCTWWFAFWLGPRQTYIRVNKDIAFNGKNINQHMHVKRSMLCIMLHVLCVFHSKDPSRFSNSIDENPHSICRSCPECVRPHY